MSDKVTMNLNIRRDQLNELDRIREKLNAELHREDGRSAMMRYVIDMFISWYQSAEEAESNGRAE